MSMLPRRPRPGLLNSRISPSCMRPTNRRAVESRDARTTHKVRAGKYRIGENPIQNTNGILGTRQLRHPLLHAVVKVNDGLRFRLIFRSLNLHCLQEESTPPASSCHRAKRRADSRNRHRAELRSRH